MEKYFEMFKELPLPALVMSRDGKVDDVNDTFISFFPEEYVVTALVDMLKVEIEKLFASNEKIVTIERKISIQKDDIRIFRVRFSKISSSNETKSMLLLTDITERKRHIEEIDRLASIVESSDDAIFSVSIDKKIMSWNKGAENIYGFTHGSMINSSVMKLIPNSVALEFETILSSVAKGRHTTRYETINFHNSGHLFPVSMSISPLIFHGDTIGATVVSRDISLRRETEEKLAISHRHLKSLMHETVESLSTAHEKRDLYTAGHQRAVSMLSCCIADEMNLTHNQLEGIRISGLLHDIGKVCIPMAILSKPAKLTFEEMALMMQHSQAGYEIVKNVPFPWPVKDIILQHHERIDGTGYPHGLRGDSIILEARILAVADVLEAMSSHRPYRPALGIEAALNELTEHSGKKYDKKVCDVVAKLFEEGSIRLEQGKLICSL